MTKYSHLNSAAIVAIDRDLAKQLFGIRDVAQRLQFVQDLLANSTDADVTSTQLTFDHAWTQVHHVLSEITHPRAGEDATPPLTMALAGGRPLHIEPESVVTVLRPDLVPIVADALQAVGNQECQHACDAAVKTMVGGNSISSVRLTAVIDQIQQFYREAKQTHSAVVFAAWTN